MIMMFSPWCITTAKVYNHYDVYDQYDVINDNKHDDASNNDYYHWTVQQC